MRVEILGDVQGVGFRFFAERRANQLGLRGWVRNRYDGAVEVEAEGPASDLERFLTALRQGPRAARIDDVRVEWLAHRGDLPPFTVKF
jgi:acylphosphatase